MFKGFLKVPRFIWKTNFLTGRLEQSPLLRGTSLLFSKLEWPSAWKRMLMCNRTPETVILVMTYPVTLRHCELASMWYSGGTGKQYDITHTQNLYCTIPPRCQVTERYIHIVPHPRGFKIKQMTSGSRKGCIERSWSQLTLFFQSFCSSSAERDP